MTKTLDTSTKLQQNPEIFSREFDGETVMMNTSLDHYFGLDEIGTRIWQIFEKAHSLIELRDILIKEYDIDKEQCLKDITPFVEGLLNDDLIIKLDSKIVPK